MALNAGTVAMVNGGGKRGMVPNPEIKTSFETLALPGAETQIPAAAGSAIRVHKHTIAKSFPTLITHLQQDFLRSLLCCSLIGKDSMF